MGLSCRRVVAGLCVLAAAVAFVLSAVPVEADGAPISVTFGFSPAKDAYYPGTEPAVEFTVVNTQPSGTYVYDDLAYMEKVLNVSAHFSWMAAGETCWSNVSAISEWLEPDGAGVGIYNLPVPVPTDLTAGTYSYYLIVEYIAHTAWGNITYYWGGDVTYHDFYVTRTAANEPAVTYAVSPDQDDYRAGDEAVLEVTVSNPVPAGAESDDVFPLRVETITVMFAWDAAPVETDVSDLSPWLEQGLDNQTYELAFSLPEELAEGGYGLTITISFTLDAPWGEEDSTSDGTVYEHAVTVSAGPAVVDLAGIIVASALLVAVGAGGAVLYRRDRRRRSREEPNGGKAATQTAFNGLIGQAYPVLRPTPGEHFPVQRGFIYLVKEKRPVTAFAMFNDAMAQGAAGMLVVREHPDRLRQVYRFDAKTILWLTRRAGKDHNDPTELSLLSLRISKFVESAERAVVLIEGMEYLITQNDFEAVLRFVNHMHDFVVAHDCAVIFMVDPRVLSTRELALLERSAKIVEPVEPAPAEAQVTEKAEA